MLANFGQSRTGALIVPPGRDPIERHVSGGIDLGGRVSESFLRSLFDPHSPGTSRRGARNADPALTARLCSSITGGWSSPRSEIPRRW